MPDKNTKELPTMSPQKPEPKNAARNRRKEPDFFGNDKGGFDKAADMRRNMRRAARPRPRRSGLIGIVGSALLWGFLLSIVAVIAFLCIYGYYAYTRMYEDAPETEQLAVLTVEQGDHFTTITKKLELCGVLRGFMGLPDRWLFRLIAMNEGNSNKIKAGAYQLNCNQSLADIYAKLVKGSKDFKLTIPEGKTAKETADIVVANLPTFNVKVFNDLLHSSSTIEMLGFDHKETPSLEGYLYPSTYYYGPGMPEVELLKMMTREFKNKVGEALRTIPADPNDKLTPREHIIMASLIEKEARSNSDRPLIASVLYNRIDKQMPLQIDATLQYAKGDFSTPPRPEDKEIDSPYNTYKHIGLPPAPICSPRVDSIIATYKAPKTDYLYYVYKGDGKHAFAPTYDEHKKNINKYLKNKNSADDLTPAATPLPLPEEAGN